MQKLELVLKAGDIVSAYAANNSLSQDELPGLLEAVTTSMFKMVGEIEGDTPQPAVPIGESYTDDHIVCLEDGKEVTLLARYLKRHYDMTFEEYREKWGLPEDYPAVPKTYSEKRSQIAKDNKLGQSGD